MLNNDTLHTIQGTAVKASGNRIHCPGAEPSHVYYIQDSANELQRMEATPKPADHKPTNFASIVDIANDAPKEESTSLWCSLAGVVAILSDDRRQRAELKLTKSPQFDKLCEWKATGIGGACLDHVSAFTHFRTLFRESLPAHGTIRDDVRKVDFQKAQQAAGEVSRTGVSMSKKLVAEASGADKLPEVLTFEVPVFAEAIAPVKVQIRVAFDLEPTLEKFRFIVLPNEIEAAIATAEEWCERQVIALLDGNDTISVYRGTP